MQRYILASKNSQILSVLFHGLFCSSVLTVIERILGMKYAKVHVPIECRPGDQTSVPTTVMVLSVRTPNTKLGNIIPN